MVDKSIGMRTISSHENFCSEFRRSEQLDLQTELLCLYGMVRLGTWNVSLNPTVKYQYVQASFGIEF